jgi:haloalkane dehalogenase
MPTIKSFFLASGLLVLLGLADHLASAVEPADVQAERRAYVDVPMGQLHVRQRGEGPAILLLHQTPWFSIQWSAVMPILANAGYRVVAPDTPGFGFSPPPPPQDEPSFEDYAAQLDALLEALGISETIVIGHHTGAGLGLVFADLYPQRTACLVLNGLPLYTDEVRAQRLANVSQPVQLKADGSHLSDRFQWIHQIIMDRQGSLEAVQLSTLSYFLAEDTELRAYRALFSYPGTHRALENLRIPTLLMSDLQDTLLDSTRSAHELRPDLAYIELEAGGSHVMLDYPQEWSESVLKFLAANCGSTLR